jgi:hypothetical protein
MIFAGAVALAFQAVGQLRELAAQGFTHDDLRNGITAIAAEEDEARAQMRSAPDYSERRKRRHIRSAAGLVLAVALIVVSLSLRVKQPGGGYQSPMLGIIAAALGAMILMTTLVYTIAAGGSQRIDRKLRRLWTGPIGRRLFESVARRVTKPGPVARVVSSELGPLTLIEEMPKEARRDLNEVSRIVSSLAAMQEKLIDREAQLASSQTEASRGSSGVATDTLDRVVNELGEAKTAAAEKRADISAALERIRLELIRLRSGIGTLEDVRSEAHRAAALISSN